MNLRRLYNVKLRQPPSRQPVNDPTEIVMHPENFPLSRRTVVTGMGVAAAAVTLAACGSSGNEESTPTSAPQTANDAGPANAIAKTADIPVGSGAIVGEVVVTQATAGDFKGFSTVCTHSGCNVTSVADGTINCPCHGSKFNLDGTVAKGPATRPLDSKPVKVEGESIVLG